MGGSSRFGVAAFSGEISAKLAWVRDRDAVPVVYMVTHQATHYYRVMTLNERGVILIGETI